jgi:hypothetical protein
MIELIHGFQVPGEHQLRLAFRTFRGADLVTVHTTGDEPRLVCRVNDLRSAKPRVRLEPEFVPVFARRCWGIRRRAAALHLLAQEPEALSCLPRLPVPTSQWFIVCGTEVAFTPNVPARWVTLHSLDEGEPVFVGQVARITEHGRGVLRLAEAWSDRIDPGTGSLIVTAAALVWKAAQDARTTEVRT